MMRSRHMARAKSCYGMEWSFPIRRASLLWWEVEYEGRENLAAGHPQPAPIPAADYPNDAWHPCRHCVACHPFVTRRGDQTRDHAALQEHDRHLRHDHRAA